MLYKASKQYAANTSVTMLHNLCFLQTRDGVWIWINVMSQDRETVLQHQQDSKAGNATQIELVVIKSDFSVSLR